MHVPVGRIKLCLGVTVGLYRAPSHKNICTWVCLTRIYLILPTVIQHMLALSASSAGDIVGQASHKQVLLPGRYVHPSCQSLNSDPSFTPLFDCVFFCLPLLQESKKEGPASYTHNIYFSQTLLETNQLVIY